MNLLTSAFRTLVKNFKIEIIGKFYVNKITFSNFKMLNASILRQNFFIKLLNKCLALVSISLILNFF